MVELWLPADVQGTPELPCAAHAHVEQSAWYAVTELVGKDVGPPRSWPTAGIKWIVPWIGRSDVPPAERRRHWDEHVELANRVHVGVSRYVRNWVDSPLSAGAPPYQGIAMQHFPSEADARERLFDSPASVRLITGDVAKFIADHLVLPSAEYYCAAGRRPP